MSFTIISNKSMRINKENKALKSVFDNYLKYMNEFDCFSVDTGSNNSKFLEVKMHIDDENFNYNNELEKKLFDAIKASNDGSYIVEMSTAYDETKVNCCGDAQFDKVSFNDISDATEWFTGVVPKIIVSSARSIEAEELFGEELSELFDYDDIVDEYEKNEQKCTVYHLTDDWCNLNKISVFELSQLVSKANTKAKAAGVSISLADDCKLFITDDCSSYFEIDIDENGELITKISKLVCN